MKKKSYLVPELNLQTVKCECQLMVGTTVPVVPGEEGSQSEAESKVTNFDDTDKALRSYEHNPLDYLPDAFQSIWAED